MIENILLPTKFAPLSQLGVGAVTTWARANPDLAKASATMLRENPRTIIDRFFRLTADQQAGLAEVSNDKLLAMVEPIAEHWAKGSFPNVQIEFEYETVPVRTAP